jgi:hypothetical protein
MRILLAGLAMLVSTSSFAELSKTMINEYEFIITRDTQNDFSISKFFGSQDLSIELEDNYCKEVAFFELQGFDSVPIEIQSNFLGKLDDENYTYYWKEYIVMNAIGRKCMVNSDDCYIGSLIAFDHGAALLGFGKFSSSLDAMTAFMGFFDLLISGKEENKSEEYEVLVILNGIKKMINENLNVLTVSTNKRTEKLFEKYGDL